MANILEEWVRNESEKSNKRGLVWMQGPKSVTDAGVLSESSNISKSIWSLQQPSTKPSSAASIAHIIGGPVQALPQSCAFTKHDQAEEEQVLSQDDIQSLFSMDGGDTASTMDSSPATARQQRAAVNYLVQIFTQDQELLSLYNQAFRKMDLERFKRNHRKLLQSFASDLGAQDRTSPSQDYAISFLQRWNTRTQLSAAIFSIIKPSGTTVQERVNHLVSQEKDHLFTISRFLEAEDMPEIGDEFDVVERDASDSNSEGGLDDTDDQVENLLPKLEATREFLCAGRAFILYKANLRRFLQPEVGPTAPELLSNSKPESEQQLPEPKYLDSEYDVSFTRSLWSVTIDACKHQFERAAGTQLCWWPLSEPEKELKPGYTRVYSIRFPQNRRFYAILFTPNRRFYDDIPTSAADSLFPKLPDARALASKPLWTVLAQDAVHLKDSTPLQYLHRRDDQRLQTEPFDILAEGAMDGHDLVQHPPSAQSTTQTAQCQKQQIERIIFISSDVGRKDSVALAVNLGEDDKATMQNLRAAFRSLPSWGWKQAIGMQFYRVRLPFP